MNLRPERNKTYSLGADFLARCKEIRSLAALGMTCHSERSVAKRKRALSVAKRKPALSVAKGICFGYGRRPRG